MIATLRLCAPCALILSMTACSNGGPIETPYVVNPLQGTTFEFALGTFNQVDSAIVPGGYVTLNVVGSLRNAQGHTAVLQDSVVIIGPPDFVGDETKIPGETNWIVGALAKYPLFGDGLGEIGTALNANQGQAINGAVIQVHAGPPAWPIVVGGKYPAGFYAYPESVLQRGLLGSNTVTGAFTPKKGAYTMQLSVPEGTDGSSGAIVHQTINGVTKISDVKPLPKFPTPSFAPDGLGGGTVTVDVPAGVKETFVNFTVSNQLCYPPPQITPVGASPETISYYTVMTRKRGVQALVLPDNLGPPDPKTGKALPTMCTKFDNKHHPLSPVSEGNPNFGASYLIYAVGVDYPAYEQSYPQSTVPNPKLTGANGQADVTASDIGVPPVNYP
jgi:hypothetical protein